MLKNCKVSVLIPIHNENEEKLISIITGIKDILAQSIKENFEIIVIDDGSQPSSNKEKIERAGGKLIAHQTNKGYGASLKSGLRVAEGEFIVIIDGDGTYPVEKIPEMIEKLEGADMVVGARLGKIVKIPFFRQPAKWLLNKIANYLAGHKIPDLNSGLRAFKKETVMRFIHLFPSGFSFTTTLTLAYISQDLNIEYIPINYFKRQKSKSKIHPIRDTKNILLTILRTIVYFDPLKICLPAGLLLILSGFSILILTFILQAAHRIQNIPDGTISVLILTGIQVIVIGLLSDLIIRRSGK